MRSLTLALAASEMRSATTGVVVWRNPTIVTSDTSKTIPTVSDANCGNESSQLRDHQEARVDFSTGLATTVSASITFRMRIQSALSFGGASYSPRCARQ